MQEGYQAFGSGVQFGKQASIPHLDIKILNNCLQKKAIFKLFVKVILTRKVNSICINGVRTM